MSSESNDRPAAPAQPPGAPGRLLALDFGSKTIGLAVTDPLGVTAQGLVTLRRRNKKTDLEGLAAVIRDYGVAEIVIGYPLHMSGQAGAQAGRVEQFAETLRQRFGLPVHLWDERLTTAEAQRVLRETDMSGRRRARVVDRLAAVLILQNFLEGRRH